MMSNKNTIILSIVLLSIIGSLLTVFLVMSLVGGYGNFFGITFGRRNNNVVFDKSFSLDEVNSFEIELDAGDINVVKSAVNEEIRVVIQGYNDDGIKFTENNGNLIFNVSQSRKIFNIGVYINDVTIYMPEEYSNILNVKNSYGDINIGDFSNVEMNVKNDCGDIDILGVKDAKVENSYGNIKIENITRKCEIENNCGDIKIQNLTITENSTIDSDLGDVKIEHTNDIYIDAKVDLGDIKIGTNNRYAEAILKVNNSCGNIKVNN